MFRTAEGTKLAASVLGRGVAFEVDGLDADAGEAWSVIVKGHAVEIERMYDAARRPRPAAVPVACRPEAPLRADRAGRDHRSLVPGHRTGGVVGSGARRALTPPARDRAYGARRVTGGRVVRNRFVASVVAVGVLLSSFATVGTVAAGREPSGREAARSRSARRRGRCCRRSTVRTTTSTAVEPDPEDPFSPGLFVPEWDQGAWRSATVTPTRTGCTTTWR